MAAPHSVLVFGAGGRTGREIVECALAQSGATQVYAAVRDPTSVQTTAGLPTPSDRFHLVRSDVTDAASCEEAIRQLPAGPGRVVVFAAAGRGYWSADVVDHRGVVSVVEAAKRAGGVDRIVLISSVMVEKHNKWHPVRLVLNNLRWGLMDAKLKGEEALRRSGIPYTIVRPGALTEGPGGEATLLVGQGDKKIGNGSQSVSRKDVAAVCVAAISDAKTRNTTFELVSKPGADAALAQQLASFSSSLQPDRPAAAA